MISQQEKGRIFDAFMKSRAPSSSPMPGMRAAPGSWRIWASRRLRRPAPALPSPSASPMAWGGQPRGESRKRAGDRRKRRAFRCRPISKAVSAMRRKIAPGRSSLRPKPASSADRSRTRPAARTIRSMNSTPRSPGSPRRRKPRRSLPFTFTLTARAENFLYDRPNLADTIMRLQAFQDAGADVLYAPGLTRPDDIETVVKEVDRPVNVLMGMKGVELTVEDLTSSGVKRISVGGAFARAALGASSRQRARCRRTEPSASPNRRRRMRNSTRSSPTGRRIERAIYSLRFLHSQTLLGRNRCPRLT